MSKSFFHVSDCKGTYFAERSYPCKCRCASNAQASYSSCLVLQAAELLGCQPGVKVLSVEADEAHMKAAKTAVKQSRQILPQLPYSA